MLFLLCLRLLLRACLLCSTLSVLCSLKIYCPGLQFVPSLSLLRIQERSSRLLFGLCSSDKSMIAAPSTRALLLPSPHRALHLRASCRLISVLISSPTTTSSQDVSALSSTSEAGRSCLLSTSSLDLCCPLPSPNYRDLQPLSGEHAPFRAAHF
ncbi:hypothetical protein CRG98_018051 [Punica granatum]|uniref:Secreted protein n=1 Tax=Punica granatum TaxID=22663 RepID=A0A2I0JZ15_PUNGR|nr:hypothetical protein CRG98_018051 [Punica granatum]